MNTKKILALTMGAVLAASTLAGCGSSSSSSDESGSSGEVKQLEILLSDDTLEGGAMAKLVEKFNSEHTDVQAYINEVAYADIETTIKNRAQAGDLPALCKTTGFDTYVDYVLPLDDTSLDPDSFNRSMVRDGKLMATDINDTAVGMVINKTAFDKAGVSYPTTEDERWTWDEFVEAVKEVAANDPDITIPFVIDHSQQRSGNILYSFGMQYFDPDDSTHFVFKSDETKAGIEFFLSMFEDGGISTASIGTGAENAQDTFKSGKVAAHLCGNWVMNDYSENITDFEWCPVLMPYEKYKATSLGGNVFFAFDGSGMEDEAKEFLEWFYEDENYTLYCETGNYLPGVKGTEVEYTVDGLDIFNMEIEASIDQPQYDTSVVEEEHSGESAGNALRDALDRAIAGELDADGVMDYVTEQYLDNLTGLHE
ncbi:MAG: ABC transporter substrate-binding protein [Lachnospiraceae bacterium]|jgi:alpha-1,4-digalacturonate transport system substrate-binding protein